MKSFDPDFSLRAYFQVKYGDVFDPRASKSPSFRDSCYFGTPDTVSWENISLSAMREEEFIVDLDAFDIDSVLLASPKSSTTLTQSTSEVNLIEEEASTDSVHPRKRRRPSTANPVAKRRKSISSPDTKLTNLSAGQGERAAVSDWNKSVIVRLQPRADEVVPRLVYTFVKLPGPDVESCVAAICAKMSIPFTQGMPVSWVDSKTLLRGPLDHAFLQNMSDMQDFVIHIIKIGFSEEIGLALEM